MIPYKRKNNRTAAVALETALMMPIFLLMLIGILEFGRAVMIHQVITNATREAARHAIIKGANEKFVLNTVHEYLDSAAISQGGRVVQIRNSSGQPSAITDIDSHEEVTVFVSIPFADNSFGMTQWFVGKNITTQVSMRRE